ncbi:hypothetical protein B0H13DRAFT_2422435 [Mycena leptocephala]|nr:hypothetical protein B0H13DRAFT_2422435 [Mycena leptocephala]
MHASLVVRARVARWFIGDGGSMMPASVSIYLWRQEPCRRPLLCCARFAISSWGTRLEVKCCSSEGAFPERWSFAHAIYSKWLPRLAELSPDLNHAWSSIVGRLRATPGHDSEQDAIGHRLRKSHTSRMPLLVRCAVAGRFGRTLTIGVTCGGTGHACYRRTGCAVPGRELQDGTLQGRWDRQYSCRSGEERELPDSLEKIWAQVEAKRRNGNGRGSSDSGGVQAAHIYIFSSDDLQALSRISENRKDLQKYDINLFQETHLRPQQHDAIDVPQGYSLLSRTRRPKASFDKSWGGVAIVLRATIPFKYREDFSGPDFMVIQVNRHLVYNVYLLPESSLWAGVLEKDPCEAFASSLS